MGDTRGKRKVHVVYDSAGEVVAVMRSNRLPEAVKAAKRAGGKVDTRTLDHIQHGTEITSIAPVAQRTLIVGSGGGGGGGAAVATSSATFKYKPYTVPVALSREMVRAQNGMLADLNSMLYGTVVIDGSEPRHR